MPLQSFFNCTQGSLQNPYGVWSVCKSALEKKCNFGFLSLALQNLSSEIALLLKVILSI